MTPMTSTSVLLPLVPAVTAVAANLEREEAAVFRRRVADVLGHCLTRMAAPDTLQSLAQGLVTVVGPLETKEAASTLVQAMTGTTDVRALNSLEQGLTALAARLKAQDAAAAATKLMQAMTRRTSPETLRPLASALATLAVRLEPAEAANVGSKAAATFAQGMTRTTDPFLRRALARGLAATAGHLEAKEAASTLVQVLGQPTDPECLQTLAQGLAATAGRLEAKEAADFCNQAATSLVRALRAKGDSDLAPLATGLAAVTAHLEIRSATGFCVPAAFLLLDLREVPGRTTPVLEQGLAAVLSREPPTMLVQRPGRVAGTVGLLASAVPFAALALSPPLPEAPAPLPAQDLVDLLKNPFCGRESQRLVLGQLSRHYGQPFADPWDFVDFVERNRIPLDLTSPPQRH
jgi:hypothetical protein